jgi:hypothetical protein
MPIYGPYTPQFSHFSWKTLFLYDRWNFVHMYHIIKKYCRFPEYIWCRLHLMIYILISLVCCTIMYSDILQDIFSDQQRSAHIYRLVIRQFIANFTIVKLIYSPSFGYMQNLSTVHLWWKNYKYVIFTVVTTYETANYAFLGLTWTFTKKVRTNYIKRLNKHRKLPYAIPSIFPKISTIYCISVWGTLYQTFWVLVDTLSPRNVSNLSWEKLKNVHSCIHSTLLARAETGDRWKILKERSLSVRENNLIKILILIHN